MPKFTGEERRLILSLVATLSIKRITDSEIIEEVKRQTNKKISRQSLYNIRQRIKQDSYHWYQELRQGSYEYIHQFKERINEIVDLQKMHHKIIKDNPNSPAIIQTSLAELHKLSITLSNLYDVAPTIATLPKRVYDNSISITQQNKKIIV